MFIEELNEFDFLDFGEKFDAYVVAQFNKDHTKAKLKFDLKDINQSPEFIVSDFHVSAINRSAAIFAGSVKAEWIKFMTEKFGEKYTEAYKQNYKQDYNNKDLLDF